MDESKANGIVKMLRGAERNCEKAGRGNPETAVIARMLVQEAILELGGEIATPRLLERIEAVLRGGAQ